DAVAPGGPTTHPRRIPVWAALLSQRHATMRYRRLTYRYTLVVSDEPEWLSSESWHRERLALPSLPRWRPDTDVYETTGTVEILVDLAGVEQDDIEVQLFEDVVIVEGHRRL